MGLGKFIYKYIFKPTLPLRYNLNHFGLLGWLKYRAGERAMKKAAGVMRPIELSDDENAVSFCFLTGEKYWHQTIFAIKSLHQQLDDTFRVKIYSDGSLRDNHTANLLKFAPEIKIVPLEQINAHLDAVLPESGFPALRYLRDWHPFFKRMIDIHCNPGYAIHLDSDMLFFNNPAAIINAFKDRQAIYMQDMMEESYFVDTEANLIHKYNMHCLPYVNGGIIAYDNDRVDYADLEQKAQLLIDNYLSAGPARIEQTLMSYLLHQQNAKGLNQKQYAIHYDSNINTNEVEVVKHYIFKAKLPYFTTEWKKIAL